MTTPNDKWIVVGKIAGVYGVRGWVKIISETAPPTNILGYAPWRLIRGGTTEEVQLAEGRPHGKGIIARFEGCEDRDRAALLSGAQIAVPRAALPPPAPGEYYWTDLEGLQVRNREGVDFGRVAYLFETGANDVLVAKGERERMVPFIDSVILDVDFDQGVITVDWDAEF